MAIKAYSKSINEAFHQVMEKHSNVIQIGVGINTPWYVGKTMNGLLDKFGEERMIDTPVSENGITGMAVGAAMTGLRPVLTFPRMDFMYYAMDQLCNHCAALNYTFGGRTPIPLTIRAIINRGGEQAAQHSQALQSLFMHIPGFKVVMPSNPYDAKGMLIAAVETDSPVIYIDDRWLYDETGEVPDEYYASSLDIAEVIAEGTDVTVIASSYMITECREVVALLKEEGIAGELIDLRSVKPIDIATILTSIKKTGKVVIVDGGWKTGGIAAEVSSLIVSNGFSYLRAPIKRVTLPDIHAPASKKLEDEYFPSKDAIIEVIKEIVAQ